MVLLAAAVISKQNGKILLSRQFVEMTRSRIEGILTAFSKLIIKDKQHTFIETDTVRYVYQALMDKLYVVLITTKTSNILEDLETLRLFARVINEYTTQSKYSTDDQAILDNAFTLLFAFDEIVALGYRESVNMSQVRTFIEMDSHEERIYEAVRKTQERDAKNKMRERAKEISKLQRTQAIDKMRGGSGGGSSMPGIGSTGGSSGGGKSYGNSNENLPSSNYGGFGKIGLSTSSSSAPAKPRGPSKALKLGSKNNNIFAPPPEEQLVQELNQETARNVSDIAAFEREPVHINVEEHLSVEISKDGAVRSSELTGVVMICVTDEQFGRVKLQVDCEDESVQIQSHPNVDKELFRTQGLVTLRAKSFPMNSSVGVLKYRRMGTSGSQWPPLTVTCWPNGNNCNVEITANKSLTDISISIPCPSQPTVNDCSEGEYNYRRGFLVWNLPIFGPSSGSATIDFDLPQSLQNEDYFPINCAFSADTNFASLQIREVVDDQIEDVKWSMESAVVVDRYEIV